MADRLLEWFRAEGGATSLVIDEGEGGRCLRMTTAADVGDVVMRIPQTLLVTADDARAFVATGSLAPALEDASDDAALALFLIDTLRRDGPWRPYVENMPRSAPRSPIFYAHEDLAELTGSWVVERVLRARVKLRGDYRAARRRLPKGTRLRFSEFVWAMSLVTSRTFEATVDGTATTMFAPLADLANHGAPPEVDWDYDAAARTFIFRAQRPLRAGDVVHDDYGDKSGARYLLYYGFVPDDAYDEAYLTLSADVSMRIRWRGRTRDVARLVEYLRLFHENERDALRAIVRASRATLARFPTSIAEDEALLAAPGLSVDHRSCVRVRLGEKRVLVRLRLWAGRRLRGLSTAV